MENNYNANQAGLPGLRSVMPPQFLSRPLGTQQSQLFQPGFIQDLGNDPTTRLYNQQFNDQLSDSLRSEQMIRSSADQGRQNLADQFNVTANLGEQQRLSGLNMARQTAQDAQLQNRTRARALGAGNSSAFLDLANRTDRDLSQNVMGVNTRVDQGISQAALAAQQALQGIEQDLNEKLFAIESDRRLSLRQKDMAINEARMQAVRASSALAQEFDWDSLDSMFGEEDMMMPEGNVNGAFDARPSPLANPNYTPAKPAGPAIPQTYNPSLAMPTQNALRIAPTSGTGFNYLLPGTRSFR